MLLFHSKYCTFFIWSWKSWNWWFWVVLKGSHTRHYARNDVCRVFVSQEKKHFFYEKIFFRILHYSTALPESSPIMKIINFHEKPWFSLIFIDFHWFWSKIMKIDGFRCSWTSPASGIRSETVCVAFLYRWEKKFIIDLEKLRKLFLS